MPGARATARKSSSSSRKTIAKAEKVTKYTNARYRDETGTLSGNQVSRLLKRGIGIDDALQLIDILQCSIEDLIRMYKCRKGMMPNVLSKARVWAGKKKKQPLPKPPPKRSGSNSDQDEVIYWIGDYCEESANARFEVKEEDTVMISSLAQITANKYCMEAAVEVRKIKKSNCIVGVAESARRVKRMIVEGKLLTPFNAYQGLANAQALRSFSAGCKVRFYLESVVAVVKPGQEFVDSDVESVAS